MHSRNIGVGLKLCMLDIRETKVKVKIDIKKKKIMEKYLVWLFENFPLQTHTSPSRVFTPRIALLYQSLTREKIVT